ncbi:hypothetical protein Hsw_1277 [Hymenobacter swuensis DY53]|uniref:Uncharacterized protein n=1 Tax=Hymenobacter swuensis DY53 TaxID=1227739 RepID=W8EYN1_9BACT|nr:hypothetical protein Hsw_1277 [Hymenobacter swuensis DY53]
MGFHIAIIDTVSKNKQLPVLLPGLKLSLVFAAGPPIAKRHLHAACKDEEPRSQDE